MKKLTQGFTEIFERDMELHAKKLFEDYGMNMDVSVSSDFEGAAGTLKVDYGIVSTEKKKKKKKKKDEEVLRSREKSDWEKEHDARRTGVVTKRRKASNPKKDKEKKKKLENTKRFKELEKKAKQLGIRKPILLDNIKIADSVFQLIDISSKSKNPVKIQNVKSGDTLNVPLSFLDVDGKYLTKKGEVLARSEGKK